MSKERAAALHREKQAHAFEQAFGLLVTMSGLHKAGAVTRERLRQIGETTQELYLALPMADPESRTLILEQVTMLTYGVIPRRVAERERAIEQAKRSAPFVRVYRDAV